MDVLRSVYNEQHFLDCKVVVAMTEYVLGVVQNWLHAAREGAKDAQLNSKGPWEIAA